MQNQMKRIIESEKEAETITREFGEDLEKGEIHKLEGKTVDYSIILNSGEVKITFTDKTTLAIRNKKDVKIID